MRRALPPIVLTLAVLATVAACSSSPSIVAVDSTTTTTASAPPQTSATTEKSPEDNEGVESTEENEPDRQQKDGKELDLDGLIEVTFEDLEAFWAEEMPRVYGEEYAKVSGGFHPYSSSEPPPSCNGVTASYDEMAGNAFYCGPDDLVAWDAEQLIPNLNENFGSFAVAVVFAHEWGHAIQARIGVMGRVPTIVSEQQADCFAGAWTAHVADGKSEVLELNEGALEAGMSALIDLRDPPGLIEAVEKGAHGVAFDRINAFQTGYDEGAEGCSKLIDDPLETNEFQFSSPDEAETGGNLDPEQLLKIVPDVLNRYWTEGADKLGLEFSPITDVRSFQPGRDDVTCDGDALDPEAITGEIFVCVPDGYVAFDEDLATKVYNDIGDWSLATLLSRQWVSAIQIQNGIDDTAKESQLASACFTGSFSRALADGVEASDGTDTSVFSISPGDLDEAVMTYLLFSDRAAEGGKGTVTAFERVRSFRTGFFEGEASCIR